MASSSFTFERITTSSPTKCASLECFQEASTIFQGSEAYRLKNLNTVFHQRCFENTEAFKNWQILANQNDEKKSNNSNNSAALANIITIKRQPRARRNSEKPISPRSQQIPVSISKDDQSIRYGAAESSIANDFSEFDISDLDLDLDFENDNGYDSAPERLTNKKQITTDDPDQNTSAGAVIDRLTRIFRRTLRLRDLIRTQRPEEADRQKNLAPELGLLPRRANQPPQPVNQPPQPQQNPVAPIINQPLQQVNQPVVPQKNFWVRHRTKILFGSAALVAIGAIGIGILYNKERSEEWHRFCLQSTESAKDLFCCVKQVTANITSCIFQRFEPANFWTPSTDTEALNLDELPQTNNQPIILSNWTVTAAQKVFQRFF